MIVYLTCYFAIGRNVIVHWPTFGRLFIRTLKVSELVSPYGLKLFDSPKTTRTRWSPLILPTPQVTRFTWRYSNRTVSGRGERAHPHPSRTTLVGPVGRATGSTRSAGSRSVARARSQATRFTQRRSNHTTPTGVFSPVRSHMNASLAAGCLTCAFMSCNAFWRSTDSQSAASRTSWLSWVSAVSLSSCDPISYYLLDSR